MGDIGRGGRKREKEKWERKDELDKENEGNRDQINHKKEYQ